MGVQYEDSTNLSCSTSKKDYHWKSRNEDPQIQSHTLSKPMKRHIQGRNFGLKSGGTNSKGERGALGSRDERGKWGGGTPSSSSWVWQRRELSKSGAPAENGFIVIVILISADRLCWQQIIKILHLFILKIVFVGVQVPTYIHRKLRPWAHAFSEGRAWRYVW